MSLERLIGMSLADAERALILETLDDCGGNRTWTARRLKVSVRTLRNKINLYRRQGCNIPLAPDLDQITARTADGQRGSVDV